MSEFSINWAKVLYSIFHVAMETTKMPNFTCQSKSFISIFFTCQISACELQPFFCHDLANDIYYQTAKTVFSHLKQRRRQRERQNSNSFRLTTLNVHHGFLYISLPSLQDYMVKVPNFTFCRGRKHKTTTFFFFPWTLIQTFRIQLQKNCQHLTN